MFTRLRVASAAALVGCVIAVSAYAQETSTPASAPAPANVAFVDGTVEVVQSGVAEAADPPVMLIEGDIVRTRAGRAEIVFGDGTLLHLSNDSELEILGDERLRLTMGRIVVRMSQAAARPYVIDTPVSSVRLEAHGEYGLTAERSGRLQLSVARGSASLAEGQPWTIRGGQMMTLLGPDARPLIEPFNSARWDSFASWSNDRANGFAASASASQLPYELRPYAPVLDQYGRWDYVTPYGYVWFPSVAASWRPYYDGAWSFTRYGWTWHGRDRWAWPTHHYGRWGYNGAVWYWIPANTWGPAWVTWSVGAGYVSWAPLGWHTSDRYDGWGRRDHPAYAPHYSPWRGWTVIPREHFGPRRNVRAHAVDGDRLDEGTRRTLINQAAPPRVVDDIAVPRGSVVRPGDRGNVRRPTTGVPSQRAAPVGPVAMPPPAPSGGAADHPAYAPATSTERGSERRGADRAPGMARPAPRQEPSGETGTVRTTRPETRGPSGEERRGASGETRSRSGEARGQSGEARGQSGEARGQSGEARGQSGEARGQSGEARGGAVLRNGAGRRDGGDGSGTRGPAAPSPPPASGARRRPGGG